MNNLSLQVSPGRWSETSAVLVILLQLPEVPAVTYPFPEPILPIRSGPACGRLSRVVAFFTESGWQVTHDVKRGFRD